MGIEHLKSRGLKIDFANFARHPTWTYTTSMNDFKVPQTFPQDLLLIQELVDIPLLPEKSLPLSHIPDDDDIRSSGGESEDEIASEEEIATDLAKRNATDDEVSQQYVKLYSLYSTRIHGFKQSRTCEF